MLNADSSRHISEQFLLYGLRLSGGLKSIKEPLSIGNLTVYPGYDLKKLLSCFDLEKVQYVIKNRPLYANSTSNFTHDSLLFSFDSDTIENNYLTISAIRLFKAGWILPQSIMPVRSTGRGEVWQELKNPPGEQSWAEPMCYTLTKRELNQIQLLYNKLLAVPLEYLTVALRRFNRSYEYWARPNLDDCYVDLVIALESVLSRGGDGITQAMKLRGSLLLARKDTPRKDIEKKIQDAYNHRSSIVHGEETSEKDSSARFMNLEDVRSLLRDTIKAALNLLSEPGVQQQRTLAETIDDCLYREKSLRNHLK